MSAEEMIGLTVRSVADEKGSSPICGESTKSP